MTTKNKKELHVKTGKEVSPSDDNRSPPSLADSSIPSSSSSEFDLPFTPRDQPTMTPEECEQKAKAFVSDVGLQWSDLNAKQQGRAMQIQSLDFTWSPTKGDAPPNSRYTTTFELEWYNFVAALPEPHKTVFSSFDSVFFDNEAVTNYMAIRRQLSGICSAHASVLYQHYIESCRKEIHDENHKMLDISSFIRKNRSQDIQKRYIEKGTIGLSSLELTTSFTGTKTWEYGKKNPCRKSINKEKHRENVEEIYEMFVDGQEPGLVSSFRVGGEFSESAILQGPIDEVRYQQKVDGNNGRASIHAMVLIGAYRSSEDGRFWFLLQNTHKDDYFKLVDGEHLASSNTTICFADLKIDMSLKGDHGTAVGEYFETALDMEECIGEGEG
jgi:hypothetical protein